MRVLIFGSREWEDRSAIEMVMAALYMKQPVTAVIHGAARGADRLGGEAAESYEFSVEAYPAEWGKYGKAAGAIRNQQMLDSGLDLAYGFKDRFDWTMRRGGSEDMARRLRLASVPFYIVGRP